MGGLPKDMLNFAKEVRLKVQTIEGIMSAKIAETESTKTKPQ
jgi:hypothetical protein